MTQNKLKDYLVKRLNMQSGDGYCFKEGTFPVLITAHMDTVHKRQVHNVTYYKFDGKMVATSPVGIGGDDRCGIYMALKILEKVDCSVLFCEDEESGSIGAKKFVKSELCKSLKGKFKYIIELDRANSNDAVFYEDDNKEFHDFVTKEFFKKAYGTWSDICTLSPALDISSVNLSCGYYKAHTTNEYVVMQEMYKSIEKTIKLLERTDTAKEPFKYIESVGYYGALSRLYGHSYFDNDYYDSYLYHPLKEFANTSNSQQNDVKVDDKTSDCGVCLNVEIITVDGEKIIASYGDTEAEAWCNFFIDNPSICYNDVNEWWTF